MTITLKEYLSNDGISSSALKAADRSMLHYQSFMNRTYSETTSPALRFGSTVHRLLEVGIEQWEREYIQQPNGVDKRTKAGKSYYEEFQRDHSEKTIITTDEYYMALGMYDSVMDNFGDILNVEDAEREYSAEWIHQETGLRCKARLDWMSKKLGLVIDFKTATDASPAEFSNTIAKRKYHLSVPHYLECVELENFAFLAIEKVPPYISMMYEVKKGSRLLEFAKKRRNELLKLIKLCDTLSIYNGYTGGNIQEVDLPAWYYRNEGESNVY